MATKHCYKGYINNGEVGFGGEVIRPNFRKRGEYEVGDAVLWDSEWKMFRVVPQEDITKITDTTRYTPTGVIAIPSSHDVYGTKEAGVMALLSASLTTPDEGQISNVGICWGAEGTYYKELGSLDVANGITSDGVINTPPFPNLPSDAFTGEISLDGIAKYHNTTSHTTSLSPSPYNADGSRNECYYATGEITTPGFTGSGSKYNALSDFAGKSKSEFLCSKATAQADWKTSISITNQYSAGYHPAACCCWRYHTVGTEHGDWYLPACGEFGYVCARRNKINETIELLQSHFGTSLCLLAVALYGSFFSTTTQTSSASCRTIYLYYGTVNVNGKDDELYVRPFTRLK